MEAPRCRFCESELKTSFADLGMSPLSNSYVPPERLRSMEPFYPLQAFVCEECYLVQLEEFESPQHIFGDYAYFSSYSDSWLKHASDYVEMMVGRFGYDAQSQVVEIASNDGYLLQYFASRGVPVLGVEPAANVAEVAVSKGVPTEVKFFGQETARELVDSGREADLLLGNNVLAHVPDLNDFVAGLKIALKPGGELTMEFPHLLQLIEQNQFDTIYHEHFSYLSLLAVERIFGAHGLRLFDVEQIPTHGGSLRIFACHQDDERRDEPGLSVVRQLERDGGLHEIQTYRDFRDRVEQVKCEVVEFLIQAKKQHKKVVGYGAPAKGNTLLNFCGVGPELLQFTVDRSPHKQGKCLPGTRIPVHAPDAISEARPDFVLILPWNIQQEVMEQMGHIKDWGGQFVVPIPRLEVKAA